MIRYMKSLFISPLPPKGRWVALKHPHGPELYVDGQRRVSCDTRTEYGDVLWLAEAANQRIERETLNYADDGVSK